MSSWLQWESWLTAESRTLPLNSCYGAFRKKEDEKGGKRSWILFKAELPSSVIPRLCPVVKPKKVLTAHLHNRGSHIESSTSEEADGFSKHLPTSIFQILASVLMSKVFFPVALLFVSASSTSSIVLFRLLGGKWEAGETQLWERKEGSGGQDKPGEPDLASRETQMT